MDPSYRKLKSVPKTTQVGTRPPVFKSWCYRPVLAATANSKACNLAGATKASTLCISKREGKKRKKTKKRLNLRNILHTASSRNNFNQKQAQTHTHTKKKTRQNHLLQARTHKNATSERGCSAAT